MPITLSCGKCSTKLTVPDAWAGKRCKCRTCGNVLLLPAAAPDLITVHDLIDDPTVDEDVPRLTPRQMMLLRNGLIGAGGAVVLAVCVVLVVHLAASHSHPPVTASTPGPVQTRAIQPGVQFYQTTLSDGRTVDGMTVWLYMPPGIHDEHSLPCVVIAPAGTPLITGMDLGDGDRPEHLPYVRAGFAVLAYSLAGDLHRSPGVRLTDAQMKSAAQSFMAVHGGVDSARCAVDWLLQNVPEINPDQIYAAGHSSAATVALGVAAADSRIKAVAAYAPIADIKKRWTKTLNTDAKFAQLETLIPGITDFMSEASPINQVNDLNCPVLLFHADDDANVPTSEDANLADALRAAGKQIQYTTVRTGGHYDSMISDGIWDGIKFFKDHGATPAPSMAQAPPPPAPNSPEAQAQPPRASLTVKGWKVFSPPGFRLLGYGPNSVDFLIRFQGTTATYTVAIGTCDPQLHGIPHIVDNFDSNDHSAIPVAPGTQVDYVVINGNQFARIHDNVGGNAIQLRYINCNQGTEIFVTGRSDDGRYISPDVMEKTIGLMQQVLP